MSESERSIEAEIRAQKIDTLLRAANIHMMRGRLGDAVTACQEALVLDAENVDTQELLGDILVRQGKHEEAMEKYRAIVKADPGRASPERKLAQLSLQLGEQRRVQELQRELVEDPTKRDRTTHRLRNALISSLVVPGLGQMYLGQYAKGVALLLVALASVFYIVQKAILEPLSALLRSVSAQPEAGIGSALGYFAAYPGSTKLLLLGAVLALLGAYIYGIVETLRTARREQERVEQRLGI